MAKKLKKLNIWLKLLSWIYLILVYLIMAAGVGYVVSYVIHSK
jgi:uncharacterized protein involved in cysteine biosynthesis